MRYSGCRGKIEFFVMGRFFLIVGEEVMMFSFFFVFSGCGGYFFDRYWLILRGGFGFFWYLGERSVSSEGFFNIVVIDYIYCFWS